MRVLMSGAVLVHMKMQVGSTGMNVAVGMDPIPPAIVQRRQPQPDQHEADQTFQRQPYWWGNLLFQTQHNQTNRQQGERVTDSPEQADPQGPPRRALARYNGRDRDQMVGIKRMLQAQQQPQSQRCQRRHSFSSRVGRGLGSMKCSLMPPFPPLFTS